MKPPMKPPAPKGLPKKGKPAVPKEQALALQKAQAEALKKPVPGNDDGEQGY